MMMRARLSVALSVGVLMASTWARAQASGQPAKPARLVFSPIPILTPDAVQGAASDKPAAFLDTAANQILIQTPAIGAAVPRAQMRYDIPNGAHPFLTVSVRQSGKSLIEYGYSLTDDPESPQGTQQFEILLPSSDTGLVSPTPGWKFVSTPTTIPDRSGTENMGTMNAVSWENPSSSHSKVAGVGLTLTSAYLPGFASGSIAGATQNPLTSTIVAGLPAALQPQLQQFLGRGLGETPYWVIAPLFKSGTSTAVIAANFHFGVSALIRSGQVDANSPYASALLQALSTFLEAGGDGRPVLPTTTASTATEKAVQTAIAIAMP
jgi:hypothetical protein